MPETSRAEYHAARTAAQRTVHDAETMLGKVNRSSALKGLPIGNRSALRQAWADEWTVPQKRAIITALVDTLVVNPASRSGARFDPKRVELTLKA